MSLSIRLRRKVFLPRTGAKGLPGAAARQVITSLQRVGQAVSLSRSAADQAAAEEKAEDRRD